MTSPRAVIWREGSDITASQAPDESCGHADSQMAFLLSFSHSLERKVMQQKRRILLSQLDSSGQHTWSFISTEWRLFFFFCTQKFPPETNLVGKNSILNILCFQNKGSNSYVSETSEILILEKFSNAKFLLFFIPFYNGKEILRFPQERIYFSLQWLVLVHTQVICHSNKNFWSDDDSGTSSCFRGMYVSSSRLRAFTWP